MPKIYILPVISVGLKWLHKDMWPVSFMCKLLKIKYPLTVCIARPLELCYSSLLFWIEKHRLFLTLDYGLNISTTDWQTLCPSPSFDQFSHSTDTKSSEWSCLRCGSSREPFVDPLFKLLSTNLGQFIIIFASSF